MTRSSLIGKLVQSREFEQDRLREAWSGIEAGLADEVKGHRTASLPTDAMLHCRGEALRDETEGLSEGGGDMAPRGQRMNTP